MISVAKDGSLCVWKLYYAEAKISSDLPYTNEVLIGKQDLDDKIGTIKGLTVRIRELESEHAYKLRQIDVLHNDKLRDVHQGYSEAIKELREKIEKLQQDHMNEMNNMNVEMVKTKTAHEQAMQRMENDYEAKLITEYDRYQSFEEYTNAMRQGYEQQLVDLAERDAEELQNSVTKYEAVVHEKKLQLVEASDEMTHKARVHERLMMQIEDDADREILEIRTNYENFLFEERQMNLKLKGEAGVMRNRFMASQKDVDDLKRQMHLMQGEYAQFSQNIQDLDAQIAQLQKEIEERDATIQDKEQRIYDMLRTNQELEKYKFVLNHEIQELKEQIEPRDQEIQQLKKKVQDTETELERRHETNIKLTLQLRQEREKVQTARQMVNSEVHKNVRCQKFVRRICTDILDTAGLVQEPSALKTAVTSLYHKYSAAEEFLHSRKADMDAQCEFIKQRELLERTIESLKKQVSKDTSTGSKDLERMTEENSTLIVELNALREQLKEAREHISRIESLLGLTQDTRSAEARETMQQAHHDYEKVREKYKVQMQEYQQIILALKEDVRRLLSKLSLEEAKGRKRSL